MSQTRTKVGLVVDRNFGPRVARLARAFHVWTVDSPGNTPYIREFWRTEPRFVDGESEMGGVTSFDSTQDGFICRRVP